MLSKWWIVWVSYFSLTIGMSSSLSGCAVDSDFDDDLESSEAVMEERQSPDDAGVPPKYREFERQNICLLEEEQEGCSESSAIPVPSPSPITAAKTPEQLRAEKAMGIGAGLATFTAAKTPEQLRGDVQVALNTGAAFQNDGTWNEFFCVDNEDCQVGDVTGDGKDDIVVFTKNGPVYVAIAGDGVNASTPAKPFRNSRLWHNYFCLSGERCMLGDVDGDGKKDLIALARSGSIWIAYSDGHKFGNSAIRGNWRDVCDSRDQTCDIGDVDGDGSVDVVGVKRCVAWENGHNRSFHTIKAAIFDGRRFVRRGAGCPTATTTAGIPKAVFGGSYIPNNDLYDLDVGDVTGDKRADVVLFARGTSGDVYVAPAVNGTFPSGKLWHPYFCIAGEDCAVADVAGDSKLDIVAFTRGQKGKVWVAPSKGNGFGTSAQYAGTTQANRFCTDRQICRVGNVDGKGKADVVAFLRGTARPVATRAVPIWEPRQSKFDFGTCRDNSGKIGIAKVRDLPPEIQAYLLPWYEFDYEGNPLEIEGWIDANLATEVIVYVAPRDPSDIFRTTKLTDALVAAEALQTGGNIRPVVVVAEKAQLSGSYRVTGKYNTRSLVLVAQSISSNAAEISGLYHFGVVAEKVSGTIIDSDVFNSSSTKIDTVSDERFFQIASTIADEPIVVDTYLARADAQFRTGSFKDSLAGLGYFAGKFILSNSSLYVPNSLLDRLEAIEALYDTRIAQLRGGLDIAGTSPNAVDALSEADAKSAADDLIDDLDDLGTNYYLRQIKSGVDTLSKSFYGEKLAQAVGDVANFRKDVADEQLAEMQSRLTAAQANLDRASSALEAAKARESAAKAALQNKPGFLDAIAKIADSYGPASEFLSYAKAAVNAAKGKTPSNLEKEPTDPGEKSTKDWLKEGAKKGYAAGSKISSAWSTISAFGSEPDCQESEECRAFMLDVEAAAASVRAATSELDAAGHAVAAAESSVRLAAAERAMYQASAKVLSDEKERARRRAQVFCSLAQDKLDNASLAVNMYRRIRALHDAPLDPDNKAYDSKRYDYTMLYDFDKSSMKQTLREAMSATAGQPLPWKTGKIVVGANDGELFAKVLRASKVSEAGGSVNHVEVDFRLVETDNGWTTLQVVPSANALDNGAPPDRLESVSNLSARRAIQVLDFELRVNSANTGALYNLPVLLQRTTANPLVLQRAPRKVQEMSLNLFPASETLADSLIRTQPGTYVLSLRQTGQSPYAVPWRYFESLDKTWTIVFEVCPTGMPTNGACVSQGDLNSITNAQLTINYRYKS